MDRSEPRTRVSMARQLSRARTMRQERAHPARLSALTLQQRGPNRRVRRGPATGPPDSRTDAVALLHDSLLPDRQLRRNRPEDSTRSTHGQEQDRSEIRRKIAALEGGF